MIAVPFAANRTLKGHTDFVKCVRVIRQHLYTGCHDKKLRLWDLATGKLIRTYGGHRYDAS